MKKKKTGNARASKAGRKHSIYNMRDRRMWIKKKLGGLLAEAQRPTVEESPLRALLILKSRSIWYDKIFSQMTIMKPCSIVTASSAHGTFCVSNRAFVPVQQVLVYLLAAVSTCTFVPVQKVLAYLPAARIAVAAPAAAAIFSWAASALSSCPPRLYLPRRRC